jgi:hypothetical protein
MYRFGRKPLSDYELRGMVLSNAEVIQFNRVKHLISQSLNEVDDIKRDHISHQINMISNNPFISDKLFFMIQNFILHTVLIKQGTVFKLSALRASI